MVKPKVYILDKDRQVVRATIEQWGRFLALPDRFVAQWNCGDVHVSTVFLGVDFRFYGKGPPLVFETMVMGGPIDGHQERSSTWQEAEQTHERMCREVRQRALQ